MNWQTDAAGYSIWNISDLVSADKWKRKGDVWEMDQNRITIYRGSHQIGGCVTEIRTGKHRIIIDFGENLPGSSNQNVMTDDELVDTIFNGEVCDGVLFTHYHGDHVGLYKRIPKDIPMYIGPTAKKILTILTGKLDYLEKKESRGMEQVKAMKTYRPGTEIRDFGDIKVTPFVVDHSALDAYMLLIEISGTRILFTGDFREHGIVGENDRLGRMIRSYIGEIDILITEGTMLSRVEEAQRNPIRTEAELGKLARKLFEENKETVILVSSTNLDRIMEFYHELPWGMGFVCDAYQARIMLTAMEDKGIYYKKYKPEQIHGHARRLCIVGPMEGLSLRDNCQKADMDRLKEKGFAMLAREGKPLFREVVEGLLDPLIIYSKWHGYLEGEHADQGTRDFIGNYRMKELHVSGHAYVDTIEKLIRLTKPKTIIPMHTECADRFAKIPAFVPYRDRVRVLKDGEEFLF